MTPSTLNALGEMFVVLLFGGLGITALVATYKVFLKVHD